MIPVAEPTFKGNEEKYLAECIESGWLSYRGPFVKRFEEAMARYIGVGYAVACSSGTSALHLASLALGIGPGDEVIVPTLTFIATANAVRYCGATPVLVDSDPRYWCIDPKLIEKRLTPKTKAIIPVHLYGHPCNMGAITGIAEDFGLKIIEDCAESLGAKLRGKMCGNLGDISCFSFFANKVVTCGEGGMCLTNSGELAEKMRVLGDHGTTQGKPYWQDTIGFNYRMTNLQAAVGLAQLEKVDYLLKDRQRVRYTYERELLGPHVVLMPKEVWAEPISWQYTILLEPRTKERVTKYLKEKGIETRPLFYPLHTMPPYESDEVFPVAENLCKMGLSLPSSPNLTDGQIKYICDCLKECL